MTKLYAYPCLGFEDCPDFLEKGGEETFFEFCKEYCANCEERCELAIPYASEVNNGTKN